MNATDPPLIAFVKFLLNGDSGGTSTTSSTLLTLTPIALLFSAVVIALPPPVTTLLGTLTLFFTSSCARALLSVTAATAFTRRVLAEYSTLRSETRPTARGSPSVGSGRTSEGHQRKGVAARSWRYPRVVEV